MCAHLSAKGSDDFEPCQAGRDAVSKLTRATSRGCLLFDMPNSDLCYAEMVHPDDFQNSELTTATDERGPVWTLRHLLFPENLEKGVILRARVLAAWFKRDDAAHGAAQLFRDFSASALPLTT